MEPLAELGGWDADDLREDAGKAIRVSEADGGGDLRNALIGETERTFGELHAYLVDVDVDINAGAPLEDAAEVGIAAMAELGQRGDGDAAFIVDADVFQCVGEDSILDRIMIAARGVGMRLRAVEQVIGLTEIFGQQLQTGEHLLHICGGRADGAAVETLRRVRIKQRLLPAGAADAACGLALIGLEKSGVDGAEQHVAVEDWDDVFTKSCVAHAKVGAAKPLTFVVHPADYGEAGVIVLLIGLHVHTEWICVREKGAERLVELLVDGDEAAEILDAELDAVYLGQIVQVLPDFFERDRHITTPFYHL